MLNSFQHLTSISPASHGSFSFRASDCNAKGRFGLFAVWRLRRLVKHEQDPASAQTATSHAGLGMESAVTPQKPVA
jgi:hypothetical protein